MPVASKLHYLRVSGTNPLAWPPKFGLDPPVFHRFLKPSTQSMPTEVLIELKRFAALGVLEDSNVRRILDNFVFSLPGHVFLLESINDKGCQKELATALHKLKGAASSCGFVGIARAAAAWNDAPEPFQEGFHAELAEIIHASIREWHSITAEFKAR